MLVEHQQAEVGGDMMGARFKHTQKNAAEVFR